jgi:hypothetical protein
MRSTSASSRSSRLAPDSLGLKMIRRASAPGLPSSASFRVRVWDAPVFSSPPAIPPGHAGAPGPMMSALPFQDTHPDSVPCLWIVSTVAT